MVYCGKPSKGCQMCRTRRIKCDETKPTCNQCAKARRHCPGYRDEFELIFRNETKATERRAQRANKKEVVASSSNSAAQGSSSSSNQSLVPFAKTSNKLANGQNISPALGIPTEELASCHFSSNFILVPRQGQTKGFMAYLMPLIKAEGQNSHLQHAFKACSLAHLGNRFQSKDDNILDNALSEYTKALSATHTALKDPDLAKTDASLAAVLLLAMYENITAKERGMFSWGSHVEGAISLVKSRGRRQLRTKTGLLLFIAVRTQMIVHTLTTANAPVMGVDWWVSDAAARKEGQGEGGAAAAAAGGGGEGFGDPATECQRINLKTSELRADVTRLMLEVARTPDTIALMLVLIRRAQTVDQDAVRWMRNLPPSWRHESVAWEDSVPGGDFARAEVYPGRVDIYQDYSIASAWNMLRGSRLILASVIVRCAAWVCAPVDYRTTPEYATAARTCVDMITDIIASVPYHLGWHLKPERRHLLKGNAGAGACGAGQLSGFACGEESSHKGLTGYYLTWPLAIVAGQDYTTDSQRTWAVGRLRYIADELGVKYARIISQLNVRVPSMLIRRDGLMNEPYPMAHDFVKLMSARYLPTEAGSSNSPVQQREAAPKKSFEGNQKELLPKAPSSAAGPGVEHPPGR